MEPTARPDNTYRLVIFHAPDDPKAVRDLLCGVTGDHPTDAAQWVARTPGIWARPISEGEVRELLDGLFDLGVAAEAWRIDAIPNLAPLRSVHEIAVLDEGLRIHGLRGEPAHWISWDKVELVHAARIDANDETPDTGPTTWSGQFLDGVRILTKRPGRLPSRSRSERAPRPPIGELHVVRKEPRIAFRLVENSLNYAYLGDRLRPAAVENFPLFVTDLVGHCINAYITPPGLLPDGVVPEDPTYESPSEMLQDTTLKLLWSWYRRDRDAARKTEI